MAAVPARGTGVALRRALAEGEVCNMLSMAEFELDRMRANFDTARSRRIARGAHKGRSAPPGYVRPPDGVLAVDEAIAPHITEVFRRLAGGPEEPRRASVSSGSGSRPESG